MRRCLRGMGWSGGCKPLFLPSCAGMCVCVCSWYFLQIQSSSIGGPGFQFFIEGLLNMQPAPQSNGRKQVLKKSFCEYTQEMYWQHVLRWKHKGQGVGG